MVRGRENRLCYLNISDFESLLYLDLLVTLLDNSLSTWTHSVIRKNPWELETMGLNIVYYRYSMNVSTSIIVFILVNPSNIS